jgi:adenine-specific DNA methylase
VGEGGQGGEGARVTHASATRLPYPDGFFDAVLTDPPYYDNVPYSYLSDFFYVWLKRSIGQLHPDLFTTPLTPKAGEIVAYAHGEGGFEAGKRFFEEQLAAAFREMARVLKPGGIAVVVYAHKSTAGWETVINALLDSGLVVNAAWPLNTEMQTRLRSNESAALASSIYIVARKAARRATGFVNEVRAELRAVMHRKLDRLWAEGVGGADFFIAAIGAGIEVFGAYEQVIDYEGHVIRADRLLDEVRALATDFAVQRILQNGFAAEISPLTRLYLLWRWNYGEAPLPFDEARKLAQSCGLDIAETWSKQRRGAQAEGVRAPAGTARAAAGGAGRSARPGGRAAPRAAAVGKGEARRSGADAGRTGRAQRGLLPRGAGDQRDAAGGEPRKETARRLPRRARAPARRGRTDRRANEDGLLRNRTRIGTDGE